MADRPRGRAARIVEAGYVAGGGALLGSAFVHWVASGPGSGLRGHELIDAVVGLGRHVPALSGARLTVLWYLVPALGAAAWIACGLTSARSRASRSVAVAAAVIAVLVAGAFARLAGVANLGWGPKLAVGGAALLCLCAWFPLPSPRSRAGHRQQ
jgi:hypothetical protein